MQLDSRQEKFWNYVIHAHGDQKRKYTNAPYTDHLWEVAELVSGIVAPYSLIPSALGHDLWEDTKENRETTGKALIDCGFDKWETSFILDRIDDLTDRFTHESYPHLNRAERKKLEADRLSCISSSSQTIKYADFISNISTIAIYDPGFAETYIKEKIRILNTMRGGDINLLIGCCAALAEAEKTIRNG